MDTGDHQSPDRCDGRGWQGTMKDGFSAGKESSGSKEMR